MSRHEPIVDKNHSTMQCIEGVLIANDNIKFQIIKLHSRVQEQLVKNYKFVGMVTCVENGANTKFAFILACQPRNMPFAK